ncbi:glutathione S-transferase omega-1-like [Ptychodera flava]|uniref:glutathione S-transferase omega-1-like n=1 Tax=Ptychodera flava TaxID=63121 RepID=UPI00396AAC7C
MSAKHLMTGDSLPPLQDGTIRLYSMRFCPFAQRSRLVLAAKRIPFEVVNCNLQKKPEWLLERNPKGQVPVLEHDGKILYESMIVNDYLDQVFPGEKTLNPSDPFRKAKDGILLDFFSYQIGRNFHKVVTSHGKEEEAIEAVMIGIKKMEEQLQKRGTDFFGGKEPGMVDYNLWPWFERLKHMEGEKKMNVFGDESSPLNAYIERMLSDEAVKTTLVPPEIRSKFLVSYKSENVQYDFD